MKLKLINPVYRNRTKIKRKIQEQVLFQAYRIVEQYKQKLYIGVGYQVRYNIKESLLK